MAAEKRASRRRAGCMPPSLAPGRAELPKDPAAWPEEVAERISRSVAMSWAGLTDGSVAEFSLIGNRQGGWLRVPPWRGWLRPCGPVPPRQRPETYHSVAAAQVRWFWALSRA